MSWEVINEVTGIIGAIFSLLGLGYFGTRDRDDIGSSGRIVTLPMIMSFLLVSGGWALICLCGFWILDPFGSYVSSEKYLKFYTAIMLLPLVMILFFGSLPLKTTEHDKGS